MVHTSQENCWSCQLRGCWTERLYYTYTSTSIINILITYTHRKHMGPSQRVTPHQSMVYGICSYYMERLYAGLDSTSLHHQWITFLPSDDMAMFLPNICERSSSNREWLTSMKGSIFRDVLDPAPFLRGPDSRCPDHGSSSAQNRYTDSNWRYIPENRIFEHRRKMRARDWSETGIAKPCKWRQN